jgi:hypothetical protein
VSTPLAKMSNGMLFSRRPCPHGKPAATPRCLWRSGAQGLSTRSSARRIGCHGYLVHHRLAGQHRQLSARLSPEELPITVWAVLDLFFTHASNGATFTDLDRQHLYRIRYQPAEPTAQHEEETAA